MGVVVACREPEDLQREQISELIKGWHVFGDHALLRRALIGGRLVQRTQGDSEYRRIEQKPPAELRPLMARLPAPPANGWS